MTQSTLTPQAPLDLGRLESEAKISATKYVANLLQVTRTALQRTGPKFVNSGTKFKNKLGLGSVFLLLHLLINLLLIHLLHLQRAYYIHKMYT